MCLLAHLVHIFYMRYCCESPFLRQGIISMTKHNYIASMRAIAVRQEKKELHFTSDGAGMITVLV